MVIVLLGIILWSWKIVKSWKNDIIRKSVIGKYLIIHDIVVQSTREQVYRFHSFSFVNPIYLV